MWSAWPAFLGASVLEVMVFSAVDPLSLQWLDHATHGSRQGVYTISFFIFWLVFMATGLLTVFLAQSTEMPFNAGNPGD
jgi:hypothetical protein